jgi:hypothetical protein
MSESLDIMPLAYIAHALSGDREQNRARARKWVSWAGRLGFAPCATWIPISQEWGEEEGRDLGLRIDKATITRCHVVLLCGSTLSPGMRVELNHAKHMNVPILDLINAEGLPTEEMTRVARAWLEAWLDSPLSLRR